jgi:hypothetical protein
MHDHVQPEGHGGHEHFVRYVPPPPPGDPGPEVVRKLEAPLRATFLRRLGARATLKSARNPLPHGSFGYVGRFVRLEAGSRERELDGTLVVGVDHRRLGPVLLESLRLFRWHEEERGFELIEGSLPGQNLEYVWARVTRPGLYALIGLNADPLVSRTLGILASLDGWLGLRSGRGSSLGKGICQVILCQPGLRERLDDQGFAQGLVESNAWQGLPVPYPPGPVGGAGDPCEKCLGIGFDLSHRPGSVGIVKRPPEIGILPRQCVVPFSQGGSWQISPIVPPPADAVLAVHAALLRTGNVLFFGGSENVEAQHNAGGTQVDKTRLWNTATGAITKLPSPAQDLFCCGHAQLADGRLLVAGGTNAWSATSGPHFGHFGGARDASIFDPGVATGNPWSTTGSLNPERGQTSGGGSWYPTLLTLPDGRVLRAGGHPRHDDLRHMNAMLEIYDPATGVWTDQGASADIPWISPAGGEAPLYPRLFVLPDGKIFMANTVDGPASGPAWHCWTYDPATKSWIDVCPAAQPAYFDYDVTAVLLPLLPTDGYRPRVLYAGHHPPNVIDLGASSPAWQPRPARALFDPASGQLAYRHHATAVLLPDASVVVVGGHTQAQGPNPPPVLTPERYDPFAGTWSTLAPAAVPRVYHSVALLLPDGRVWTAGSDYGPGNHEARIELFSPPYLFRGPRPTVTSVTPSTLTPGGATFDVATPDANAITAVALIRCGTATHAYIPDQRYVGLVVQSRTSTKLTIEPPPSNNIAPPGYYLLFLLDTNGVPSRGEFVRIT